MNTWGKIPVQNLCPASFLRNVGAVKSQDEGLFCLGCVLPSLCSVVWMQTVTCGAAERGA